MFNDIWKLWIILIPNNVKATVNVVGLPRHGTYYYKAPNYKAAFSATVIAL